EHGVLTRRRAEGKLKNLEQRLLREPLSGTIGIGHTRWAIECESAPSASTLSALVSSFRRSKRDSPNPCARSAPRNWIDALNC
ncbi:MAG: hypothetical protein WBF56_10870, partial [Candidatus Acidiferrales bacterium]